MSAGTRIDLTAVAVGLIVAAALALLLGVIAVGVVVGVGVGATVGDRMRIRAGLPPRALRKRP